MTHHEPEPIKDEKAPPGRSVRIEHARARLAETAERVGSALERPLIGASVAGGLVAAIAGIWGPAEALLGAAVGLVTYRVLRRRRRHEHPASPEPTVTTP